MSEVPLLVGESPLCTFAGERGGNTLHGFAGRGAARSGDAQGTPNQCHISPRILVFEHKDFRIGNGSSPRLDMALTGVCVSSSLDSEASNIGLPQGPRGARFLMSEVPL